MQKYKQWLLWAVLLYWLGATYAAEAVLHSFNGWMQKYVHGNKNTPE